MSNSGIAVMSSQNSAVLLATTEASLFRIPTSFPPKFVTSKPSMTVTSNADVMQAIDGRVVAQQVQPATVSSQFTHHTKFKLASLTFKAVHTENSVHTETPPLIVATTLCILKPHHTSLILFLTILPVFLGHLPHLTSYRFLSLTFFSFHSFHIVLSCPSYLGTFLLTQSVHPIHLTLFGSILIPTFFQQLMIPPRGKLHYLQFVCCD